MTLEQIFLDLSALLPELLLSVAICAAIVFDFMVPLRKSRVYCGTIGIIGLLLALLSAGFHTQMPLGITPGVAPSYFGTSLIADNLSIAFKLIFICGTLISLIFAMRSPELAEERFGEFVTLLLGSALAACVLASAGDFIVFVLALETLSLCSYVLAAFQKHQRHSAEAGIKYTLYGSVASGVMLFGISYIYGLSGTLLIKPGIIEVVNALGGGPNSMVAMLSLLLLVAGLGFKIAMVPFHFWCPDVYEGAPTPVTAFLSVVSKAAGFSAFLRLAAGAIEGGAGAAAAWNVPGLLAVFFGIMAAVTMTVGNLIAIRQTDLKRLLAYSSIAHAGYLLLGLTVLSSESIQTMLMYLVVYLFMNLGAFWVIVFMAGKVGSSEIEKAKGLASEIPTLFAVLFICLIALVGLPPTAGFAAKFLLFKVVVGAGVAGMTPDGGLSGTALFYFGLALLGVLNSVVSLYYYMKIAKAMVFEKADTPVTVRANWFDNVLGIALAVPVLLLLNFGPLWSMVREPLGTAYPLIFKWFM